MRKSRCARDQIIGVLFGQEADAKTDELCRCNGELCPKVGDAMI